MTPKKIVILATGGTIAGLSDNNNRFSYRSGSVPIAELLHKLALPNDIELLSEQVCQIDSSEITFAHWQQLLRRCQYWQKQAQTAAIIITHGTDTIEETSFFLHAALPEVKIPLIFTCAMRPSNVAGFDGIKNLTAAIHLAVTRITPAVYVVCAGRVHHARFVQKVSATRLNPFSSKPTTAAGSIKDGRFSSKDNFSFPPALFPARLTEIVSSTDVGTWPQVEILFCYIQSSAWFNSMLEQLPDGLVIAANGNLTLTAHSRKILLAAQQKGVEILLTSRCNFADIIVGSKPPFNSSNLPPYKARIYLLLKLLLKQNS